MEKYDIYWFEEPINADDYIGYQKLTNSTFIPIATGENEYTRYGFRDLISYNAGSIYNADAQILGGITEFIQVASLMSALRHIYTLVTISFWTFTRFSHADYT